MNEPLSTQVNTRMTARDKTELEMAAAARRLEPLVLARVLLREGIRRERHPAITFRDGGAGRRAALEGHRLDVWQVMETLWNSDGDVEQAAEYLGVRQAAVRAALAYCADYPDEVDAMVQHNRETADRAEAQFRRERQALRR